RVAAHLPTTRRLCTRIRGDAGGGEGGVTASGQSREYWAWRRSKQEPTPRRSLEIADAKINREPANPSRPSAAAQQRACQSQRMRRKYARPNQSSSTTRKAAPAPPKPSAGLTRRLFTE